MDAAASLDGSELVEIVQGGANVQTTTQDIADLGGGGGGGWTVIDKDDDFTANDPSGTMYTNNSSGGGITCDLEDSQVGTHYGFFNLNGNTIQVNTAPGNNIVFWDKVAESTKIIDTDDNGEYMHLGNQGNSLQILKATASNWIAIEINGTSWSD